MEMIRVRFACGCMLDVDDNMDPQCERHHEHRIVTVIAPPPRIRAVGCDATGPLVTQET